MPMPLFVRASASAIFAGRRTGLCPSCGGQAILRPNCAEPAGLSFRVLVFVFCMLQFDARLGQSSFLALAAWCSWSGAFAHWLGFCGLCSADSRATRPMPTSCFSSRLTEQSNLLPPDEHRQMFRFLFVASYARVFLGLRLSRGLRKHAPSREGPCPFDGRWLRPVTKAYAPARFWRFPKRLLRRLQ